MLIWHWRNQVKRAMVNHRINSVDIALRHFSSRKAWVMVVGMSGFIVRLRQSRFRGLTMLFLLQVCILWWFSGGLGGGDGEGGGVGDGDGLGDDEG